MSFGPPHLGHPPSLLDTGLKAFAPVAAFFLMAPVLWLFFGKTWRELDLEAHEHRRQNASLGGYDKRPAVLFVITATVLLLQEYYGGRQFFEDHIRPALRELERTRAPGDAGFASWIDLRKWGELYSYGWWAFTRVFGYVVVPFATWKILFPKDSLLDMGLRSKGLLKHVWIYGLCLAVVIPALFIVARSPDFGTYYPFYKQSSRSGLDLLIWEIMYFAQFFALEIFFRGFWLNGLRTTLGSGAIFAMCVPYCMIHFGKPYLEAGGAVIAGVALGSLAMKTKSIYSGFLVHVTVALLMDVTALTHRNAMPTQFWPP